MGKFKPTIIRLLKKGKYIYLDIKTDKIIEDGDIINFIEKLRIPPVWKDVKIDIKSTGIMVTGIDSGGKKQYIYSKEHVEKVSKIKFCKLLKLDIKKLEKDLNKHLNSKVITKETMIAMIVKTMWDCSFRIGTIKCLDKHNSHGISTIQKKHISFSNNGIKIEFVGKKKITNRCVIINETENTKTLINLYKKIYTNRGINDFIFMHNGEEVDFLVVNNFLKEYGTITTKDFRTLNANTYFLHHIVNYLDIGDEKERKKISTDIIIKVADKLHHTIAICKKNYLLMDMINMYITNIKKFNTLIFKNKDPIENFFNFLKWYCK